MNKTNPKPEKPALFWSGGKDSLLALRAWQHAGRPSPILVTTYDDESEMVPFQEIPISRIYRQALQLGLPLVAIPLSHPVDNITYLSALKIEFSSAPFNVNDLIFGDLHLDDIRNWREEQFRNLGMRSHFPIWHKSVDQLLKMLEQEEVKIVIRHVAEPWRDTIKPGMRFNREFVRSLPGPVDPFGENGEFHTEVIFNEK
jgi:diphthamide synthase (EF-2-diphthine--ammonia ligase)